ncbi:MAG: TlpA disulfide reductase family protein [Candidatus Nanopelagicales bacterium]|jgi:thiol-disulfide isomerase/thioredoxin
MNRRLLAAGIAVAAVSLVGCSGGMYAESPVVTIEATSPAANPQVGLTIIPEDEREGPLVISGRTADGTPISTEDSAGDVVVVNAWASWCPPCREELPLLNQAAKTFAPDGVVFVGLNSLDDPIAAASLLATSPYRSINDEDGAILQTIPGVPPSSLPSTVILDREGRVAVRVIGPVREGQLEGVLALLIDEPA